MTGPNRHIAFIDVLGLRRALALGRTDIAERKLLKLADAVERALSIFPQVQARGATDFFLLWSDAQNGGWLTAQAAVLIFQNYFDNNSKDNVTDVDEAYLLRGGLAYGSVEEVSKETDNLSYSLLLGSGLGKAYETQCVGKGMRLFMEPDTSKHFEPLPMDLARGLPQLRIDKNIVLDGSTRISQVRWIGTNEEAERRLARAATLFRKALNSYGSGAIGESELIHYQQTLCVILNGCSTPEVLLRYVAFGHGRKVSLHEFLAPVWTTAWLRLIRPKNEEVLPALRDKVWDRFIAISESPSIGKVTTAIKFKSRWRPLVRLLGNKDVRFRKRKKKIQ